MVLSSPTKFVLILSWFLPVSLCSDDYFLFLHKNQRHAPCRLIYCTRWQINDVPSQSWLPSCRPLTAETAPAFFGVAGEKEGSISICQLHPTLASRNWKVTDFSARLRGRNPNHFSFIYAATLTVEIA